MNFTFIVTIASIIGTVANVYQKHWCFIIWLFTNGFWCTYDFSIHQYAQGILFAVYFVLAVIGLIKWRKKAEGRKDEKIHSNRNFRYGTAALDNRNIRLNESSRS